MAGIELKYELNPTQLEYVHSDKVVNVIISNTGEGKTFASIAALIVHAQRCGKPIRCAIVRDTLENIKLSVARSIEEFFGGDQRLFHFKNEFKQLTIFTEPRIEIDCFGIDDLASLGKLQGPEYALIWLNEPAPIADKMNAGLPEEAYNVALVRCARQKGTIARLQVDMNPADEEHWTYRRFIEDPDVDPENPLITKQVWFVPYGENRDGVSETSRQAVKSAYKDDPAAYQRYVLGQFATVYHGKKVTPEYNPLIHLAPGPLTPARGLVSFRMWDSWTNPACVMGQITTTGRLIFLDVLRLENSDVRTLIETQALPMLNSPRWKGKAKAWRDGGDCTMKNPDQSNIQTSAARAVEDAFKTIFEPGPTTWAHMNQGIKYALNKMIQGQPAVILDPVNCKLLHKGLSGAWHYPVDNSGQIKRSIPDKNEISHPCDGWANGVNILLPGQAGTRDPARSRQQAAKAKRRASSYAGGG